ncbi:serine protease 7-like [Haematobia irritans]|uniref:serine protease 7-like n=1 Tax=Haematobia irritans TaxID=7368 RepID=UPI003F50A159
MVCCSSDVGFDAIPNGGHRNGKKLSWWPSVLKMFLSSLKSSNRNDFRPARKVKEPLVQNSLLPEPPICGGEFINNRIYGGTETHIYEFPWMAFLEYTKADPTEKAICGGSLITSRSVITAAHCVVGKVLLTNGELISVRLGINDHTKQSLHSEDNNRWYIAKKIVHEDYNEHRSYMNDIALLRLARNVPYTKTIRPICLPSVMSTHHISTDTKLTVVGWGKTETRNHSPIRQKVNVLIADQKFCTKQYGSRGVIIDSTHICATGYLANQDSCFGDSGGPLMTHRDGIWVLDGIVSFGRGCGHSEWPGVYARVDQYTDWINKKINAKDIRKNATSLTANTATKMECVQSDCGNEMGHRSDTLLSINDR